jgi:signal peptidase I
MKTTWRQALQSLFLPVFLILIIRWAFVEPFVIPSGSMIPTLRVHDHILANKIRFGLRIPFTQTWLIRWGKVIRGDILVFRYPPNPKIFYIKRVIGLPGDEVEMIDRTLYINGEPISKEGVHPNDNDADEFEYFLEGGHQIRYALDSNTENFKVTVPQGSYFFMGDNRDQSSDSRVWGPVPEENIVGSPILIWLACTAPWPNTQMLCDPAKISYERIFHVPF